MFICAVVTAAIAAPVSRKRRHIIGPDDYSEYIYDEDYYNDYHEEYNDYLDEYKDYQEEYYDYLNEHSDYHDEYNDYVYEYGI